MYTADENFIRDRTGRHVAECRDDDTAAFIVRACNSSSAMLDVCEELRSVVRLLRGVESDIEPTLDDRAGRALYDAAEQIAKAKLKP